MSRRTAATIPRGRPHIPREHPDVPGTCADCNRPLGVPNDMHVDQLPPTDPAVAAAEARRFGEREDNE